MHRQLVKAKSRLALVEAARLKDHEVNAQTILRLTRASDHSLSAARFDSGIGEQHTSNGHQHADDKAQKEHRLADLTGLLKIAGTELQSRVLSDRQNRRDERFAALQLRNRELERANRLLEAENAIAVGLLSMSREFTHRLQV